MASMRIPMLKLRQGIGEWDSMPLAQARGELIAHAIMEAEPTGNGHFDTLSLRSRMIMEVAYIQAASLVYPMARMLYDYCRGIAASDSVARQKYFAFMGDLASGHIVYPAQMQVLPGQDLDDKLDIMREETTLALHLVTRNSADADASIVQVMERMRQLAVDCAREVALPAYEILQNRQESFPTGSIEQDWWQVAMSSLKGLKSNQIYLPLGPVIFSRTRRYLSLYAHYAGDRGVVSRDDPRSRLHGPDPHYGEAGFAVDYKVDEFRSEMANHKSLHDLGLPPYVRQLAETGAPNVGIFDLLANTVSHRLQYLLERGQITRSEVTTLRQEALEIVDWENWGKTPQTSAVEKEEMSLGL